MEKNSPQPGSITEQVRPIERPRYITASELAASVRSARFVPGYGQRSAGMKPGTYVVACDLCHGTGILNVRTAKPMEPCHKCASSGTLEINGERHGDGWKRNPVTDYFFFLAVAFVVAAIACVIIIWRANAW